MRPRSSSWALRLPRLGLALAAISAAVMLFCAAPATSSASGGRGILALRLVGLPRGERGSALLIGPSEHRRISVRGGHLQRLSLAAGSYVVRVLPVRVRRTSGTIRASARALPVSRALHTRIRAHRLRMVDVRYGTIVNPGVKAVGGEVVAVAGNPQTPSGVTIKSRRRVQLGQVLSARPSSRLPNGLLAKATSVTAQNGVQVIGLEPASMYEVAPNLSFDIPLSSEQAASISQEISCDINQIGIGPYAHVSDFHLSGGWTTQQVLWAHVTTGATIELHYKVSAGLQAKAMAGVSCSVNFPVIGFQGMAGPIPVYGGIRPTASAELGGAATLHAGATIEVTTGVKISALPPVPIPIVNFGSPHFEFGSNVFASATASLGLDAELGIGVENAVNLHADLGNSLNFTASPGACSWDLELGSFSATGQLGPFSISTPSTPALYSHNLWHRPCGATPQPSPSPPSPPSPPPPPPAPALPQVRAVMSWNTGSDIDLYTWDDQGHQAFWIERTAIPNAELVQDIIPVEGENEHPPEVFQETAEPNRHYTFGICDFRGPGAQVKLTVTDPGGATRTYQHTLTGVGDSAVITASPEGNTYTPPEGWCHHIEEEEPPPAEEEEEEGG